MANEGTRQQQPIEGGVEDDSHPQPPPFNPIVSASAQATVRNTSPPQTEAIMSSQPGTGLSPAAHSVVPDLMRVYESMTGSSATHRTATGGAHQQTADTTPGADTHVPYDSSTSTAASTNYSRGEPPPGTYYPTGWTYDTTSIPIPPIPENALAAMTAASSTSQIQQQQQEVASSSSGNTTAVANNKTGRSLRKRSPAPEHEQQYSSSPSSTRASKSRRKNKETDGRWSKRFTWPEELHRDFVSAIFDVGLKHSSPSAILEHMPQHEQITSERIKSHLQKYRLHRIKSKKEFMTSYDASLHRMQRDGLDNVTSLAGGQVAGHLAFTTLNSDGTEKEEEEVEQQPSSSETASVKRPATRAAESQDSLIFPLLTEEEKRAPIGAAMGYLMGLFFTLKQQLKLSREAKAAQKNAPVNEVYNSFVHGHAPAQQQSAAYDVSGTTTARSKGNGGGSMMSPQPSTRSNLEENNMMKREMQIQMAFQNKMRALKQQEQQKYKSTSGMGGDGNTGNQFHQSEQGDGNTGNQFHQSEQGDFESTKSSEAVKSDPASHQVVDFSQQQGAGEQVVFAGDTDSERGRQLSISAEDFWNTDVVDDDQLFEFLMNH